ncbi:MAG: peptide deformylase [Proteobacteria bacterium]|nr:peptide deformylase [Pseudomonadota bacterium]
MAILKIARIGHPVLSRIAEPVADPQAPEIHRLIADMVDTMADAPGIGLAAPQVHVPKRVVIFHIPERHARAAAEEADEAGDGAGDEDEDEETSEAVPMTVLINPEIEFLSDEIKFGVEACLSLPDMAGMVPRHTHIRYKALAPDGSAIEREASGYHARVVQHECDHLDGILYPMRMEDLSTFGYADEMNRNELPLGDRIRANKAESEND